MSEQPNTPDAPADDASGEEPEEESGAGYGNHAPDADTEPVAPDEGTR